MLFLILLSLFFLPDLSAMQQSVLARRANVVAAVARAPRASSLETRRRDHRSARKTKKIDVSMRLISAVLQFAADSSKSLNEIKNFLTVPEILAEIDAVDANGRTALHWAVIFSLRPVVQILLAAGASPSACSEKCHMRWTPLHWAASNSLYDIYLDLLRAGGDRSLRDIHKRRADDIYTPFRRYRNRAFVKDYDVEELAAAIGTTALSPTSVASTVTPGSGAGDGTLDVVVPFVLDPDVDDNDLDTVAVSTPTVQVLSDSSLANKPQPGPAEGSSVPSVAASEAPAAGPVTRARGQNRQTQCCVLM